MLEKKGRYKLTQNTVYEKGGTFKMENAFTDSLRNNMIVCYSWVSIPGTKISA